MNNIIYIFIYVLTKFQTGFVQKGSTNHVMYWQFKQEEAQNYSGFEE